MTASLFLEHVDHAPKHVRSNDIHLNDIEIINSFNDKVREGYANRPPRVFNWGPFTDSCITPSKLSRKKLFGWGKLRHGRYGQLDIFQRDKVFSAIFCRF